MTVLDLVLGVISILWVILTYNCVKDDRRGFAAISEDLKGVIYFINFIIIVTFLVWLVGNINWNYKIKI